MLRPAIACSIVLALAGCQGSDDTATGSGSSSGSDAGDSATNPDSEGTSSDPSTTSASTEADTTCAEACATSSGSTGPTTVGETGNTTGGSSDAEVSSGEPAESSSSDTGVNLCGNGVVDAGEDCDDSGESATCNVNCTMSVCGDAVPNATAGEACDAGGESFMCDVDCTLPMCGDGLVNASTNELCDEGLMSPTCDPNCTAVACGDGTQNLAALETCDDGDNMSGDGCSSTCVIEGDFGGQCRIVDGTQWCFDNDHCGEACNDVCASLGLTLEPSDATWFAAQDTPAECQAISDALGMSANIDFGNHPLGCLEDGGANDLTGGGLTGGLRCSSDPGCPAAHRNDMDDIGTICDIVGARRSVCPCNGIFCGNGVVEGTEVCDDGNQINNDGCTTQCLTTPPTCQIVNGVQWCYDNEACGQACNDVCAALGLAILLDDATWFAAQDTAAECQEIADAFGMPGIDVNSYSYACLEDSGINESVGGGLTGSLLCSTFNGCPTDHRTNMDGLGLACGMGARRSICPCG